MQTADISPLTEAPPNVQTEKTSTKIIFVILIRIRLRKFALLIQSPHTYYLMRTILIFFSLNLIVLLFSCAEQYDPQLLEAERIIEEYPDSALAIVNGVEQEHKSSPLYGLLYVQARTKTHHIELSDSLIERSAQAFRRNGDKERLMKALFYKGVVKTNCKRYDDAIIPLMEAYSMAESKQD
ncbi:MAG: hypothetical protein K2L74_09020, partial [Muribaculaceae bacterium]|nr:hypothetical protein [Muribaculaceae bacterium]